MQAAFLEELIGYSGFTVLLSTICATQWELCWEKSLL